MKTLEMRGSVIGGLGSAICPCPSSQTHPSEVSSQKVGEPFVGSASAVFLTARDLWATVEELLDELAEDEDWKRTG